MSPQQIALQTEVSERTIYRWLETGLVPSGRHSARSASVIDPYRCYLLQRWQEGSRKGVGLYREIKEQGYRGSERAVYRYLSFLRASSSPSKGRKAAFPSLSAKQMTWLLVKNPSELDEQEREDLALLRQASSTANTAYILVQDFVQMVRQRQGERLGTWLKAVEECPLPELQTFAAGIQRDLAAVQAGLTLPYSNGLLEGHVNRLKLIKRSMYGRAKFDLLRLRVLCAA